MINKEFIKRWVSALRSGQYEQGQLRLNRGGKFCCLGVACDLLKDELELVVSTDEFEKSCVTYDGQGGGLPEKVLTYTGFKNALPELGDGRSLHGMNDTGVSFETIADILELEYLK